MLRRLIVNADDFGLSPGVNAGIIDAHMAGIVTSTSLMVNSPHAAAAISDAAEHAPRLGIGLHLTLTSGRPIADPAAIPALLGPDGRFRSRDDYLRALPDIPEQQIETELRAQAAAFAALAGRPPDHLDSHHHATYRHQSAFRAMARLARELDVPVRSVNPPKGFTGGEDLANDDLLAWRNEAGLRSPDGMIGSFYGDRSTLGDLLNLLAAVPEGQVELMCHPARVDEDLRRVSSYVEERSRELANLCHPSARELCIAQFIQLISFADLPS